MTVSTHTQRVRTRRRAHGRSTEHQDQSLLVTTMTRLADTANTRGRALDGSASLGASKYRLPRSTRVVRARGDLGIVMASVWGLHGRLLAPRERTARSRAPVGGEEPEAARGFSRSVSSALS